MSLDVYLVREETVFDYNITHNLNKMAEAAGLYKVLWRPEEIGVTYSAEALPILKEGLKKLVDEPEKFKAMNPENGWGSYEGLLKFVVNYIEACEVSPELRIRVSR